jgi:hypothetical protein
MTIDRRQFILGSAATGVAAACAGSDRGATTASAPKTAAAPPARKSILILGGTGFGYQARQGSQGARRMESSYVTRRMPACRHAGTPDHDRSRCYGGHGTAP